MTASPVLPAPGEEVVACILVTRAPGGFLLRYTVEGRELLEGVKDAPLGPVAGCFAPDADEVLALGAAMIRSDRAALRRAIG